MPLRSLSLFLLLVAGLAAPSRGQDGAIRSQVPDSIDLNARYVFYLHGRIIEVQGRRPTHPEFGVYEYDARTGKRHGAFYQAWDEWLAPVVAWIETAE